MEKKSKYRHIKMFMDRIFPKSPDFFEMFMTQLELVAATAELLVEYMETGEKSIGNKIRDNEIAGSELKALHLSILGDAFTTPIDREDIYRTFMGVDEMLKYFKATVTEMKVFNMSSDKHMLDMAVRLRDGVLALQKGYNKMSTAPQKAIEFCNAARKEEAKVEKLYRLALVDLFQGKDFVNMFKRREIYRHISNAADRLRNSADILQHIVVKIV